MNSKQLFELYAKSQGYLLTPAVSGSEETYLSTLTQIAYEAWEAKGQEMPDPDADWIREPFLVGNTYRTLDGELVRFVYVHKEGTSYETMSDEFGVHRYTNREGDSGRVTGRLTDHPKNVPPLYRRAV